MWNFQVLTFPVLIEIKCFSGCRIIFYPTTTFPQVKQRSPLATLSLVPLQMVWYSIFLTSTSADLLTWNTSCHLHGYESFSVSSYSRSKKEVPLGYPCPQNVSLAFPIFTRFTYSSIGLTVISPTKIHKTHFLQHHSVTVYHDWPYIASEQSVKQKRTAHLFRRVLAT